MKMPLLGKLRKYPCAQKDQNTPREFTNVTLEGKHPGTPQCIR